MKTNFHYTPIIESDEPAGAPTVDNAGPSLPALVTNNMLYLLTISSINLMTRLQGPVKNSVDRMTRVYFHFHLGSKI